jgi:DNA-binding NarL/FixJ family response regulator
MSRIRVMFADDQALIRAGLEALLRSLPGVELVRTVSDAQSALDHIATDRPDVLVSDIRMPGISGIALTQQLRQMRIMVPVLLLTTFEDPALFLQARKAGAQGFLLKDTSPEVLLEAILTLHQGGTLFEPRATNALQSPTPAAPMSAADLGLSTREVEILRLMAGGYANKEIANALHLAEGTIKNYVSEIMAKLDCTDRTRAVLKAIAQRVI